VDVWLEVVAQHMEPTLWPIIQNCITGPYVGRERDQVAADESLRKLRVVLGKMAFGSFFHVRPGCRFRLTHGFG
jgi:hypothetical protein